jgi:hypothetical protein
MKKLIKAVPTRFTNASLHEKALSNAIKLLNAIGVEYAIQDHDGTLHGNGVLQTKAKRQPAKYPYGTLSKHVRPYVDACGVNQTVTIPISTYDLIHVYGSASSIASKVWGNGCHKIGTSDDKKNVILTRTEKLDDMDDLFSQLGIN